MRSETAKSPASSRGSDAVELVGLDLGEVAELADVDAEDRHRRRVHEIHRVQHRAVAAERDARGRARRANVVGVDRELVEPGRPRRRRRARAPRRRVAEPRRGCAARARAPAAGRGAAPARPRVAVTRALLARGAPRRRARPRSTVAGPRRACARNSTLPSAPRNGDGIDRASTPSPRVVEPADDFAQHRRVHLRIAHDAAPADPRPARLELRLHQQHEVGVGGREREQVRRDGPQRDEREVGDAQIGAADRPRPAASVAHVRALHHRAPARPGAATTRAGRARRRSRPRAPRRAAAGSR